MPGVFQTIGAAEVAKVNLPVAVPIWLMIISILLKIDFAALGQVSRHWSGYSFIDKTHRTFILGGGHVATSASVYFVYSP